MAKKREITQINCFCSKDLTRGVFKPMFQTNAENCQCQFTTKKGVGPTTKVKRVAVAIT